MNKLKNEFKEEFNQINLSDNNYENVNIKIKEKYKKYRKNQKILYSILTIISLIFITSGVVYADELKNYVKELFNKVEQKQNKGENGKEHDVIEMYLEPLENLNTNPKFKKKNYNCIIDEINGLRNPKNCEIFTQKELEDLLNIKVLTNNNVENNEFIIDGYAKDKDGNIKYIEIDRPNIFKTKLGYNDSQKKYNLVVTMRLKIKSKYHKGTTGQLYALDGEHKVEKYRIKNLKVDALIVKEDHNSINEKLTQEDYRRVYFIYENIGYILDVYSNGDKDNLELNIKNLLEELYIN